MSIRNNGEYAKHKLDFLDRYFPYALAATERKLQRYYVDLCAGPGLNEDERTHVVFEGSPLRAIKAVGRSKYGATFTHAHLFNKVPADHKGLIANVQAVRDMGKNRTPSTQIYFHLADANDRLPSVMNEIERLAYVFAFADMEGPQDLRFDTIRSLRALGHRSVDLYLLFPTSGIKRIIPYGATKQYENILTPFFGTDEWDARLRAFPSNSQARKRTVAMENLYIEQLRQLWSHVIPIRRVRMTRGSANYLMLFASQHDVASNIAGGVVKHTDRDAPELKLEL